MKSKQILMMLSFRKRLDQITDILNGGLSLSSITTPTFDSSIEAWNSFAAFWIVPMSKREQITHTQYSNNMIILISLQQFIIIIQQNNTICITIARCIMELVRTIENNLLHLHHQSLINP